MAGSEKCPHCREGFFSNWKEQPLGVDAHNNGFSLSHQQCPLCGRKIIMLHKYAVLPTDTGGYIPLTDTVTNQYVYPRFVARSPLSGDVPDEFANDYREACLILADSPKASAALSRRCLQHLIHEKAGITKRDLYAEIQEVLDTNALPAYLSGDLDAVRHIGNFAAHPIKSTNTGEIVDVEPGEAEWSLNVIEGLFDFYFVQPAAAQRRRDAYNDKLKDAGKPALKTTGSSQTT